MKNESVVKLYIPTVAIHPVLVVLAAGVTASLHVSKLSPALPLMRDQLGMTLVQSGFFLSLVQMAGMMLGLALGLTAEWIGLRRSLLIGMSILAAASFAGSFSDSITTLLVLRALEGAGFLLVALPAPSLIRKSVNPDRIHTMLGIWGAYMPFGAALALILGPALMVSHGWQGWWKDMAIVSLLMVIAIALFIPADPVSISKAATLKGAPLIERLRKTLGTPGPWAVALTFTCYSAPWMAVMGFLPSIYVSAHLPVKIASALTALVASVNIIGNVTAGRLLQHGVAAHKLLFIGFLGIAISSWVAFGLTSEGTWGVGYVGAIMFSLLGGIIPGTLFSQAVQLSPNEECISTSIGWMQQCNAAGQFIGPPIAAFAASRFGGWHITWVEIAICSAMGICFSFAQSLLTTGKFKAWSFLKFMRTARISQPGATPHWGNFWL